MDFVRRVGLVLLLASVCAAHASALGLRSSGGAAARIVYPIRIAYVTDEHLGWAFGGTTDGIRNYYFRDALIDTLNHLYDDGELDLMVMGGDWSWQQFTANPAWAETSAAQHSRMKFPVFPVLGNWEIDSEDTLACRSPAYTPSTEMFPSFYGATRRWYHRTWKNIEFVSLNIVPNLQVANYADYEQNNPETCTPPSGGAALDWDGISLPASPQRAALRTYLAERDKSKWLVVGWHRQLYGSEDPDNESRLNYTAALTGDGFYKEMLDSLGTSERMLCLVGDQHFFRRTQAVRDSAIAARREKGGYHLTVPSGSGLRAADSLDVFGSTGWLGAQVSVDLVDGGKYYGRTSTGWMEALASGDDVEVQFPYLWALITVYGDHMMIETFRMFSTRTNGKAWSTGARTNRLVDSGAITRDSSQQ